MSLPVCLPAYTIVSQSFTLKIIEYIYMYTCHFSWSHELLRSPNRITMKHFLELCYTPETMKIKLMALAV